MAPGQQLQSANPKLDSPSGSRIPHGSGWSFPSHVPCYPPCSARIPLPHCHASCPLRNSTSPTHARVPTNPRVSCHPLVFHGPLCSPQISPCPPLSPVSPTAPRCPPCPPLSPVSPARPLPEAPEVPGRGVGVMPGVGSITGGAELQRPRGLMDKASDFGSED